MLKTNSSGCENPEIWTRENENLVEILKCVSSQRISNSLYERLELF